MSLQKGFFFVQSSNPNLPPEEWELVYENTTAGDYNVSLGWGKYRFEICGGGGSGAALTGSYYQDGVFSANLSRKLTTINGYSGYVETGAFSVLYGETSLISGKIGSGGTGAYSVCNAVTQNHTETPGAPGSGGMDGVTGTGNWAYNVLHVQASSYTHIMVSGVSGSGGGSSSILQDNLMLGNAKGGRGGGITEAWVRASHSLDNVIARINSISGGDGGNSGTTAGAGNNGGASVVNYRSGLSQATGYNGGSGYIRIYKSNLKPEPL